MLSIVIPVYNEEESLVQLHKELSEVAAEHDYQLDIIFVDDGSSDSSWDVIEKLCEADKRVRGIRFRRNFGKAAALSAGFEAVRGEVVMTLDADLQDDPHEIPRFLEAMNQHDVVSGYKEKRHDPWHKVLPSRVFNWLVSRMTGVKLHDHNCGFKCYRREVFHELRLYGELHRFVPVLAAARGWRIGEIVVNHRRREFGQSKYGLLRIPKGFLDLLTVKFLTGFGQRPQHMLGSVGLTGFSIGILGITAMTAWWVLSRMLFTEAYHLHLTERAIFYYFLAFAILGAQFMSVGFIAELMTSLQGKDSDTYSVSERTGGEAAWRVTDSRKRIRDVSQIAKSHQHKAVPNSHLSSQPKGESTKANKLHD
ncbi:MAG: glycosyltransferase family 2 protein [Planctomycetales bacterium]|nr:glycosyltransferase family 2 protein [Planctomycetales bacterium]